MWLILASFLVVSTIFITKVHYISSLGGADERKSIRMEAGALFM